MVVRGLIRFSPLFVCLRTHRTQAIGPSALYPPKSDSLSVTPRARAIECVRAVRRPEMRARCGVSLAQRNRHYCTGLLRGTSPLLPHPSWMDRWIGHSDLELRSGSRLLCAFVRAGSAGDPTGNCSGPAIGSRDARRLAGWLAFCRVTARRVGRERVASRSCSSLPFVGFVCRVGALSEGASEERTVGMFEAVKQVDEG